MMRILLFFFVVALVLAGSHWLIDEKGYVLISFNQTTIEGTLVSFGFLTFIGVLGAWLSVKLMRFIWQLATSPTRHWSGRRSSKQQQVLEQGLWAILHGNWQELEKQWQKASLPESWQTLQSAALVKAAIAKQDWSRAREHVQALPTNAFTTPLIAQLQSDTDTVGELAKLAEQKNASTSVIQQYADVLVRQRDFTSLTAVVVKLQKRADYTPEQWQQVITTWFSLTSSEDVSALWQALPKSLQQANEQIQLQHLAASGQLSQALPKLQKMLKKGDFDSFAAVMCCVRQEGSLALQQSVQQVLKSEPNQPALLLSLAALALAGQDPQLAAKIFDSLGTQVPIQWKALQKQAYIADGQYQKACLI
jgi:HemY protein